MEAIRTIKTRKKRNFGKNFLRLGTGEASPGYLGFAFAIPFVLMYLLYLAMEIHPFGDGSVLVLDLNGQYVYFYEALRNFVYGDTSLLYSFSRALGGEFMGIYGYYLASPFSYLVCLFPQNRILEALLFIFLLKTGLCGFTFGYYLHRTKKCKSKIATVIFSCMYALSSYAVVQQHNSMWIDAVIWLPVITLAIEELVKYGKFRLYVVFLTLTVMSNFYIGYMVCIYCAAYFFAYYLSYNGDGSNNPLVEKRHFIKSLSRFALFSLVSVCIAAVVLLPVAYSLSFGKSTFTHPDWKFAFKFDLADFFVKFFPGSYDTVRPEGLPFVYCGVLTIILVPVYFLSSAFTNREKIMSGLLISFFGISFSVNVVDMVWHGLQRPNWLNYRYSFMLVFILLVLASRAFGELRTTGLKTLFAICVSYAAFVVYVQKLKLAHVDDLTTIWFSLLCVFVYLILLCVLKSTKSRQNILLIMAFCVAFELYGNGLSAMVDLGDDVVYSSYGSYNDFIGSLRPVVNKLKEYDGSFYRAEKTNERKVNDNMALGLRGMSNSTSTLNASTVKFLHEAGYNSRSHWSSYTGGCAVNDSLFGIKYVISNKSMPSYYKKTVSAGDYTAWENPYALPLAYGIASDLSEIQPKKFYNPMEFLNATLNAMCGSDEEHSTRVFVPVPITGVTKNAYCKESTVGNYFQYEQEREDQDAVVRYDLVAPEDGELYFFISSDYQNYKVRVRVNGQAIRSVSFNDPGYIMEIGNFKKGEDVHISVTIDNKGHKFFVRKKQNMVYRIDEEALASMTSKLAKTGFDIEKYSERSFSGFLNTSNNDQIIFTSIPFDKGWHVKVDGENVETFEVLGALTAFRIASPGNHEIKISYMPAAFVCGLVITFLGLAAGITLFALHKKIVVKDRRKKDAANVKSIDSSTDTSTDASIDSSTDSDKDSSIDSDEDSSRNSDEDSSKDPAEDSPIVIQTPPGTLRGFPRGFPRRVTKIKSPAEPEAQTDDVPEDDSDN